MTVEVQVSGVGLVVAVLSMLGNGTFGIFGKLCKREPDPILFNACLAIGIMLSSLLCILFFPLVTEGFPVAWTWPGALSGLLLVVATAASFVAISLSGLATAQATWSCAAILVSFLWGALGPKRDGRGPGAAVGDWGLTILSVVLLVSGVAVINSAGQIAARLGGGGDAKTRSSSSKEAKSSGAKEADGNVEADDASSDNTQEPVAKPTWQVLAGLLAALTVGISGGSILVPESYVPEEMRGLLVLPSLGLAAGPLGCLVFVLYWSLFKKQSLSLRSGSGLAKELQPRVVLYGIISGFFWNFGNICQIIALDYLHMPYGVSYPILQCALVVAGMWGIFVFKEITERLHIVFFFVGVLILLSGVVLLGAFGPGS